MEQLKARTGSEQLIPACLVNVQTLHRKDMWYETRKGTSCKYIDMPRGLLFAGKFKHPYEDFWVSFEVQKLDVSNFKEMGSIERMIRSKYIRLCVFITDEKERVYRYAGGDIVRMMLDSHHISEDEVGFFGCLALAWIKNSFTSCYWKSIDYAYIYNRLVHHSETTNE